MFNKKVIITWSFGTWKSTIISLLEKNDFPVINEVARKELDRLWLSSEDLIWKDLEEYQLNILKLQIEEEKRKQYFITDTSLVENLAYSQDLEIYSMLEKLVKNNLWKYDYIFYFPIEIDLENDEKRYLDIAFQKYIDEMILSLYKKYWYELIVINNPKREINEVYESYIKRSINHRYKTILNFLVT